MASELTRRSFFGMAGVAGGVLAAGGPMRAGGGVSTVGLAAGLARGRLAGPIAVVTQSPPDDLGLRGRSRHYIGEILAHAGIFFERLATHQLPALRSRPTPLILLPADLKLTGAERELIGEAVRGGSSLIAIGGTSGLDELFGVTGTRPLAEGWLRITASSHPITAGLRSSLHVFGGCSVRPSSGTVLAQVEWGQRGSKGAAVVENRFGKGRAILLAPDLLFSIVHIQQGLPVFQDGKPSPDGTAPINDGILKAEDGLVLDWQRDRTPTGPEQVPVFLEPIADELRELILRSVFYAAREQGLVLPVLWYWPRALKAVGHISHDTDGNDPERAVELLDVMRRCKVKSTWCTLYPGGYPRGFYKTLQDEGYEVALHYDARSGGERTSWSKDNFAFQRRWLMKEAGVRHIATNKNHYTRWEGRLEFFRWCEELGIESDQSRGPSKRGTMGFPLGGSHPYFPIDDESDPPRMLPVLEVNLLVQDMLLAFTPGGYGGYGRQLLEAALRHYGIAHVLFHPARIRQAHLADTIVKLVDYGRSRGLEWWTSQRIHEWETLRRGVEAAFDPGGGLTLKAGKPLHGATLLVLRSGPELPVVAVAGRSVQVKPWRCYGFDFAAATFDIMGRVDVRIG